MNNFRSGLISLFNKDYLSGDLDKVAGFIQDMCLDKRYKLPILKRVMRAGNWRRTIVVNDIEYDMRVLRVGNVYKIKIMK